jgi:hypothetical protein
MAMNAGRKKRHGYEGLVRRILRTEAAARDYRPTPRPYTAEPPPPPKYAEDVIAAVSAHYPPGSCIGLQQVIDVIAVSWDEARRVRAWAEATGAWPWLRPSPVRKASRPGGGAQ